MSQCSRCEGKRKIILFTSIEDPCKKCKGTGLEFVRSSKDPKRQAPRSVFQKCLKAITNIEWDSYYPCRIQTFEHPPTMTNLQRWVDDFKMDVDTLTLDSDLPHLPLSSGKGPLFFDNDSGSYFRKVSSLLPVTNSVSPLDQPSNSIILLVNNPGASYASVLYWEDPSIEGDT